MVLCGTGSGFIASIGISVLLIGLVVYYFNVRLRALERTAQKQNQVIASFIGDVQGGLAQGELRAACNPPQHGGAAPGAIRAAQAALCRGVNQCAAGRIPVSDDEGDTSAGSSEGESGTDSDSYSDDESQASGEMVSASDEEPEEALQTDADAGVKVIDLGGTGEDNSVPETDAESVVVEEVIDVPVEVEASPVGEGGEQEETPAADGGEEAKKPQSSAPESLKVPELRDLVVERELATAAEARGMKKAKLVALLDPPVESSATE